MENPLLLSVGRSSDSIEETRRILEIAKSSLLRSRVRLSRADAAVRLSQDRLLKLRPEWRSRRAQLALLHALVMRLAAA